MSVSPTQTTNGTAVFAPPVTAYLAIPTRERVVGQVAEEIFKLADRLNVRPHFTTGHLSAGDTRTRIVADFLATDADALLMIDDDVAPHHRVPELLGRLNEWPVLAAAVPVFKSSWPTPAIAAFRHGKHGSYVPITPAHRGERIVECDAVGTGCIAIRRDVLEQLPNAFSVFAAEDLGFCEAVRASGHRIGCDFQVVCDHLANVSLLSVMNAYQGGARSC